jgi:hypothetical protein
MLSSHPEADMIELFKNVLKVVFLRKVHMLETPK